MKTRTMLSLIAGASLAATGLTGCGDPLVTAEDHGDALFGLHGEALAKQPPSTDLQVGVLFLRVRYTFGGPAYTKTLETEIVPGTITGNFPAQFKVSLSQPPEVYPYEDNIIYITIDGGYMDGVFDDKHAPEGVRIGHLVIGPAAELSALPAELPVSNDVRVLGPALSAHLPNTTITPYQVIYAEGVGAGDVIYPKYLTNGGIEGGKPISEGFTLVDARTYFEATIWQECANEVIRVSYQDPAYQACMAASAPLQSCLHSCPPRDTACEAQCEATYPGQFTSRECMDQVAQPKFPAACGPEKVPHQDQLKVLKPQDKLTVQLGDDDVKAGMWMLHATSTNP